MCKKAQSFWLGWLLAHPGSSLIPGFPGKPGKSKENFHAFQAFPYVQKSPGLLTGMISGTSWLFLDSWVSWKAWKSQEKFTTWHSWLLLDCGVSWKAWKSQEKTLMKSHIVTVLDCFKSVTTFLAKTNTNKYFLHKYRLLLSHIVPVLDYDKYFNVYFTSF